MDSLRVDLSLSPFPPFPLPPFPSPAFRFRLPLPLMIETLGTVESNSEIAPTYRLLTLRLDQELLVSPGQFAMLRPHGLHEPLLRRALAFYRQSGPSEVSFLYQVLGRGTQAMAGLGPGQHVEALPPLGNSWTVPQTGRAIVVSGGIGSASLLMLCQALKRNRIDTRIFFGAASAAVATGCGLRDFEMLGLPLTITTDDGGLGEHGFVTQPLERHLKEERTPSTIYACGPWAMMKRVA